jgi:hypothetical protein
MHESRIESVPCRRSRQVCSRRMMTKRRETASQAQESEYIFLLIIYKSKKSENIIIYHVKTMPPLNKPYKIIQYRRMLHPDITRVADLRIQTILIRIRNLIFTSKRIRIQLFNTDANPDPAAWYGSGPGSVGLPEPNQKAYFVEFYLRVNFDVLISVAYGSGSEWIRIRNTGYSPMKGLDTTKYKTYWYASHQTTQLLQKN